MKKTYRPTVMDGAVFTFARDFQEKKSGSVFGGYEAIGPYEISASRNQIIVHYCELKDDKDADEFLLAFYKAWNDHADLREGIKHPERFYNGEPLEIQ